VLVSCLSLRKGLAAEKSLNKEKARCQLSDPGEFWGNDCEMQPVDNLQCRTLVYAWTLVRLSGIFQPLKCSSATRRWKSFGARLRSTADAFCPLTWGPCKCQVGDKGIKLNCQSTQLERCLSETDHECAGYVNNCGSMCYVTYAYSPATYMSFEVLL
jgi:hypothetical protein